MPDIDWDSIEGGNQEFTDVYPRIQWIHGKKALKQLGENSLGYRGGLFIPADQFPGLIAEGWTEATFTASNGKEIDGYHSTEAKISVIRLKKFWDDDGSHVHAICCLKGVDAVFSLQVGGLSKGQAFINAFAGHRNQVVAMANRNKPPGANSLEPCALWFLVSPGPHSQAFSKANADKSSEVTEPVLNVPKEITVDYVRGLWVGTDSYKRFIEIFKETEAWQTQIPKRSLQADSNFPEYAGSDGSGESFERAPEQRLQHLIGLIHAKNQDEKQTAMAYSLGTTDRISNLSKTETENAIAALKLL
jgi:hypothetical protein